MIYDDLNQSIDEEMALPETASLDAIRAALVRSRADAAAGRVVEGSVVTASLKTMIEQHEMQKTNGTPNS